MFPTDPPSILGLALGFRVYGRASPQRYIPLHQSRPDKNIAHFALVDATLNHGTATRQKAGCLAVISIIGRGCHTKFPGTARKHDISRCHFLRHDSRKTLSIEADQHDYRSTETGPHGQPAAREYGSPKRREWARLTSVIVTERARKLRSQYGLLAQGLRSRLEMRVNRIPTALRKTNIMDLVEKYSDQPRAEPPTSTLARPTPSVHLEPSASTQVSPVQKRGTKRSRYGLQLNVLGRTTY